MLSYCLKCKKNTKSINPKVSGTSNGGTMILSKCTICGSKKSKFIKKQEAKGLLSSLGIRTPLSKIPLLGDVLFELGLYKINYIINKSTSSYWLEINLCLKWILDNQGLSIVLVDHLQKIKKEYKSLNKLEIQDIFYKNELDKACFEHDMAYGDFKDLKRITADDEVLRDKAFNIAKTPKYDRYQRGLASMVYKFFDKKTKGSGVTLANKSAIKSIPQNEQLAEELHKPVIIKF